MAAVGRTNPFLLYYCLFLCTNFHRLHLHTPSFQLTYTFLVTFVIY